MPDPTNSDNIIFGTGHDRCQQTGRPYEQGSGALPHAEQTARFIRERDQAADMPKTGEICAQTGRPYETGRGCRTKSVQSRRFVSELSPAEQAQRTAAAQALYDIEPAGRG